MRLAILILGVTLIAGAMIHIRQADLATRHEIQRLQTEQTRLRREIWSLQVEAASLGTPQAIRLRAEAQGLEMTSDVPVSLIGSQPEGDRPR